MINSICKYIYIYIYINKNKIKNKKAKLINAILIAGKNYFFILFYKCSMM